MEKNDLCFDQNNYYFLIKTNIFFNLFFYFFRINRKGRVLAAYFHIYLLYYIISFILFCFCNTIVVVFIIEFRT